MGQTYETDTVLKCDAPGGAVTFVVQNYKGNTGYFLRVEDASGDSKEDFEVGATEIWPQLVVESSMFEQITQ